MFTMFSSEMSTPSSIVGEQKKHGQFARTELLLALLSQLIWHLSCMLMGFKPYKVEGHVAVEVDKKGLARWPLGALVGTTDGSWKTLAPVPAVQSRADAGT
jgi:hypothetical protein